NRAGKHPITAVEMPQLFSISSIEGVEIATRRRRKNKIAAGRQYSRPRRRGDPVLPLNFARLRLHRNQLAPTFFGPEPRPAATASAEIGFAGLEFGRICFEKSPAFFAGAEVEQARLRTVARRHPVVAAIDSRPNSVVAFDQRLLSGIDDRTTVLVDLLRPSLLHILFR